MYYDDVYRSIELVLPFKNKFQDTDPAEKELRVYKNKFVKFHFVLIGGKDIDLRSMEHEFFGVFDDLYKKEGGYYDGDDNNIEFVVGQLAAELSRRLMRDVEIIVQWQNYTISQRVSYRGVDVDVVMTKYNESEKKKKEREIADYKKEITGETYEFYDNVE